MSEFDDLIRAATEDAAHEDRRRDKESKANVKEAKRREEEIFRFFVVAAEKLRRAKVPMSDIAYLDREKKVFSGSRTVRCVYGRGWLIKACYSDYCAGRALTSTGLLFKAHDCQKYGPYEPGDIILLPDELANETFSGFQSKEEAARIIGRLLS